MDPRKREVPLKVWLQERGDHAARRTIHVDRDIEAGARFQIVECASDLLDRLVETSERNIHHTRLISCNIP